MATRLPSGNYRTLVFVGFKNGKRKYKSFTARSARAADLAALQWQSENPSVTVSGLTLRVAIKNYIEQKRAVLSPSTIRGYVSIEKVLKENYPTLMKKKIADITRDDLQNWVNRMSRSISSKTVRNYYWFVNSVMEYNGIRTYKITLPSKVRPELNIPDEETLKRLFEASRGTDMEIPILLGAIGPMRRGEIVAASIDDLDGNILHVHRAAVKDSRGKQVIKNYPKTYSSDRYILLPESIVEKIRSNGYVCNLSLQQVTDHFRRLLDREGIKHFRFHDLRHAFVSIAHAAGLPDAYIQERGGWSTNYTMINVYRHTLDADRKKEQDAVNEVFDKML